MRESSRHAKRYLIDGIDCSRSKNLLVTVEQYAPQLLAPTEEMQAVRQWIREHLNHQRVNAENGLAGGWIAVLWSWASLFRYQDETLMYEEHLVRLGKARADAERHQREREKRWQQLSKRDKRRKLRRINHKLEELLKELEDDDFPDAGHAIEYFDSYGFFYDMTHVKQAISFAQQENTKPLHTESLVDILETIQRRYQHQAQRVVSPPKQQGNPKLRAFVAQLAHNQDQFFTTPMSNHMVASIASACYPDTPCTTDDVKNWKK